MNLPETKCIDFIRQILKDSTLEDVLLTEGLSSIQLFIRVKKASTVLYNSLLVFEIHSDFRFVNEERVLTGSADIFVPNSDHTDYRTFDYQVDYSLFDEKITELLERPNRLEVEEIFFKEYGDIEICFNDQIRLQVHTDIGLEFRPNEKWRIAFNEEETNVWVMTTEGLILEGEGFEID